MFTVEKNKISNQILFQLRKQIVLNKISKGYHLNETAIARDFNTSRGPVREALTQLEFENLVEKRSNGRTVVTEFTYKDIENLYKTRIILEKAALTEIDMKALQEGIGKFYQYIEYMEDAYKRGVVETESDLSFHKLIMKLSGNKTFLQLWLSINGMILTLMDITNEYYLNIRQEDAIYEHLEVIRKMEQGKIEEAQHAIELHLKRASDHYMKVVNEIAQEGMIVHD